MQERQTRLLLGKKRVFVCVCVARPLLERYSQIWIISRKAPCDDLTGSPASGSTQSASALGGEGTPEVPCSTSPRSLGTARIQGVLTALSAAGQRRCGTDSQPKGTKSSSKAPRPPAHNLDGGEGRFFRAWSCPLRSRGTISQVKFV